MKLWMLLPVLLAQTPAFRWARPVVPGAAGPHRLDVDLPLLTHAEPGAELADLRLYDSANREVGYLLIPPRAPEPTERWRGGRLVAIPATRNESGFELDLGKPATVDRFRLDSPGPFLKRVRLEGSGDRAHWVTLVGEGTLFDLPGEGLADRALDFAPGDYRYLRLTWDDHSSARVPLPRSAEARLSPPGAAPRPAPLTAAIPFERRASEPGTSRFRLKLPGRQLPIVALSLGCGGGHLLRQARVLEPRLGDDGRVAPRVLGTGTLRRTVQGDLSASDLRLAIGPPEGADLDLVVDDGDNPPLELGSVTAELAPQPWIYFEATDAQPLTARFGSPKLQPPRYDLEAMRTAAEQSAPPPARWGEIAAAAPAASAAAQAPAEPTLAGAPLNVDGFAYSRPIPPGPRGLTAVALDAAVLAHSEFGDLRIVQGDGHQIPYLLERRDEPLASTLALQRSAKGPPREAASPAPAGVSAYTVELPYARLPPARLVLTTAARVFDRRVTFAVERAPDAPPRSPPLQVIEARSWSHADADNPAPALDVALPSLDGKRLWVLVDEGDNQPLPLSPPQLLLPSYRLRFFRQTDGPLTLLYGKPELQAPRYDLALLAPQLVGAVASEVTAGPEAAVAAASQSAPMQTKLFWGALSGAVIVLLGFMVQLLRKQEA
ncbi:MAG TPA: DUF3999 family protein [Myxococcales bacterium]|nr:DUF3999 family protein [Myxococcales bacterium]